MEDMYLFERFKWKLLRTYKGKDICEAIGGGPDENQEGGFHRIVTNYEVKLELPTREQAVEAIMSDLELVRGIGPATATRLKEEGIRDIVELTDSQRWCSRSEHIVKMVDDEDLFSLQSLLQRCHSMSHPGCYLLSGFTRKEDLLFFDIETMGLRFRPLFLIGVGRFLGDGFRVEQFFARDTTEEKAVIREFLDFLSETRVLVSFNGRAFDSRFIKERMDIYGLQGFHDLPHFDLLPMSRGRWPVPDHRLTTLEKWVLGQEREEDVSSSMVPHLYELYLRKNNPGPVIPIIEHNKMDIVSMVSLLQRMGDQEMGRGSGR